MFRDEMNLHMDQGLKDDIMRAINGEYSAIDCYGRLIKMAPTEKEREVITEIRNDEIKHFNQFCALYTLLTNEQPDPKIIETCPAKYEEGLQFAFEDEQHTVDFYYEIADQANHPLIRRLFCRAAADEQNHAVWFLSMMKR